jgi:RHS repeat-associated protein
MSRVATLLSVMLLLSTVTFAQSDGYVATSNGRGLAPENSFQVGDIDTINLANGALNLRIPLYSRKGRGMSVGGVLNYSSKVWYQEPLWDVNGFLESVIWTQSTNQGSNEGFSLQVSGGGLLTENQQEYDCEVFSKGEELEFTESVDSGFIYRAEDGSSYRFPNVHVDLTPNYQNRMCYNISAVNQGNSDNGEMMLDTTNHPFILYHKDGTKECVDIDSSFNPCPSAFLTDTNGNTITFGNNNTIVDTIGRSFNRFSSPSVVDSNGNIQNYTISSQGTFSGTTQFPSATEGNGTPVVQGDNAFVGTETLTLPDGRIYGFSFDPNFGEVTKVTLPTGGYIRYQYTTLAAVDTIPSFTDGTCCLFVIDSRRVAARFVSSTGLSQDEKEWQYSYSGHTTTATDPLGNVSIHTFSTDDRFSPEYETLGQYYQGSSTLLKTIANVWAHSSGVVLQTLKVKTIANTDWRLTSQTTTLNDTNQMRQETNTYDTYSGSQANLLSSSDFDWGNGASGPLLRRTVYTYLHDSNTNYQTRHILDRIASKTVYDSTNNTCAGLSQPCAQITYGYDSTTISSKSGVVQHDYTDYPTTMTYRGNQTTSSVWRSSDGALLTTTNYYNELGNLLQVSDPLTHSTYFDYTDFWSGTACIPSGGTANAFVTKITNALSQFVAVSYFPCSSLAASKTDLNSQTTSLVYDLSDRLTQQTLPDGGQTTDCYSDVSGGSCYTSAVPPLVVTTTKMSSSQNRIDTMLVDGLGRSIETQVNSAPQTVYMDTTYDALGRKSTVSNPYYSTSDPTYGITTYAYDPLNRTTQVTAQDGSIFSTTYSGNCTTGTDPQGKNRESCSDGLGRMTSVIENPGGLGYQTTYTYDALNDLTTVTQSGQRQRSFKYNSLSELTQATNPESGTVCYGTVSSICQNNGYDSDGNLMYKTDARGTLTTYSYDALNRSAKKQYSDSTSAVYFNYDGNTQSGCTAAIADTYPKGRRTGMCDSGTGSAAWSHDPMGRVLNDQRTTNNVPKTTVYTYSPFVDGSIYKITYPSSLAVTYTYDAAERPTSALDSNGNSYVVGATYAPHGGLQAATMDVTSHFGGFSISNSYTKRLQPNESKVLNSSSAVVDFSYCFYALISGACPSSGTTDNGNAMAVINNVVPTRSQTFTYDALNRVSIGGTVNTSGTNCWGEQYGYDTWGNLLTISFPSQYNLSCAQPDNLSVGVSSTTNQINNPSGYVYDAAGNLTTIPNGGGSYTYNAENQLTSTAGVNYIYDGNGNRIEKNNGILYWYGVSSDTLEETNLSGTLTNDYVFFGEQRIARLDSVGNIFAYFADTLGSSRRVEEIASGATIASLSYDSDFYPFGRAHEFTNTSDPIHKFTGKERDAESGLDNFDKRYNASSMGRFMSPDPVFISANRLTDPQSLNLYAYVRNNPLSLVDPTGLDFYLACKTSDHSGCGQVDNGSEKGIWVQGQTVNGSFQATDVDMNKQGDPSAGYSDQFGNNYTGTFDQNGGVSFTNTAPGGATSTGSQFIDGSDNTQLNGSGAFANITGNFFSDCGGSCQGRASLSGSPEAFAATEAQLHKQGGLMTAIDLLSGAHKAGSQWKDSNGYVHMLNPSGQMEMHFEGHPTGVDVQQFVLHMVDTIRDAASGRAAAEKNTPLP